AVEVGQQRVHHDVADQVHLVVPVALGPQIGHRVGGGGEQVVAHSVGDDAVNLLGHAPVAASQPRLDVREQGAGLRGDERATQGGVHVPDHDDHVRAQLADQRLE